MINNKNKMNKYEINKNVNNNIFKVLGRQKFCDKSGSKNTKGTFSICLYKFLHESNCLWSFQHS